MTNKPKAPLRMKMTLATLRSALSGGPSITFDTELPGLALHVGRRRAFWALHYSPHGMNPATGKRWGSTRLELGVVGGEDGMTLPKARAAALTAKGDVKAGKDPHRAKVAQKEAAVAARAVRPTTLAEALDAYEKDMLARREPSETTRRQEVHYARKAIVELEAGGLAVGLLHVGAVRRLIRAMDGSSSEVRHVYGSLSRFCGWMVEEGLISANPCDAVPRRQRPKPGKDRDRVPPIEELQAVWAAVKDEHDVVGDLVRFMILAPLRRDEIAGLVWGEVAGDRLILPAHRMKNRESHELPLSPPALEILDRRRGDVERKPGDLVFPAPESGAIFNAWSRLIERIREAIGQGDVEDRDARFTFHDIRRGFETHLGERGHDEIVLQLTTAHKRRGVHAIYQRAERLRERAAAINTWAALLLYDKPTSSVVPLARVI